MGYLCLLRGIAGIVNGTPGVMRGIAGMGKGTLYVMRGVAGIGNLGKVLFV